MKRWVFGGLCLLILFSGLAFAQDKMTITFKDGRTQSIDINTILKIEYQATQPASSDSLMIDANRFYRIVSRQSNKCVDVEGVSTHNGANVSQYDCHGGKNQAWKLIPKGQDYYMIIAAHSNKCLDVAGLYMFQQLLGEQRLTGRLDGANIQQWDCHGGANQLWKIVTKDSGYYLVVPMHTNKCMDVAGGGTHNGANIQQWSCHGGNNQMWKIE